jgi:succinyl-CoA synthetase beta subunit
VTRVGPLRGEDRRRVRGRVYVDCGIERCVMPARAVVRYLPQDGASVAVVVRLLPGRFRRCRPADRCDQFLD